MKELTKEEVQALVKLLEGVASWAMLSNKKEEREKSNFYFELLKKIENHRVFYKTK